MSAIEKLFEAIATLGKPLFIFSVILLFVLVILIIAYAKKSSKTNKLEDLRAPYKHWDEVIEDDIYWYALPSNTKLAKVDHTSAGTVAQNLSSFISNSNLSKIVENYFYGDIEERTAIWVKVVSISSDSPYIEIESETGNRFIIKKPNRPLTVSSKKRKEDEKTEKAP